MKYYVVWKGHQPGIYTNWQDTQQQVHGYTWAEFKSFPTKESAQLAFEHNFQGAKGQYTKEHLQSLMKEEFFVSIATDAACPNNPGPIEYRGVDIANQQELFRIGPLAGGSTNIAEYLGIVHGISWILQEKKHYTTLYSDSKIAINRVMTNSLKTQLQEDNDNKPLRNMIRRAQQWLFDHPERKHCITLKKRPTKERGQIPADFGRK